MKAILIKTSYEEIKRVGSLYEAIRGHWYLRLVRAKNYTHVIAAIKGEKDIKAVYKVLKWEESDTCGNRIMFEGVPDTNLEKLFVGKELNPNFFTQGRRNPCSYIEENTSLVA